MSLSLADARRVIAAGERRAHELGQPMNIAVVDEDGNLVSHVRMDGAWTGSVDVSLNKAFTARALRASRVAVATPAYDLAATSAYGQSSNGLPSADPHAASAPAGQDGGHRDEATQALRIGGLFRYGQDDCPASDGPVTGDGRYHVDRVPPPASGLALLRAGRLVGAVGVSGGDDDQDRSVAEAAARAL